MFVALHVCMFVALHVHVSVCVCVTELTEVQVRAKIGRLKKDRAERRQMEAEALAAAQQQVCRVFMNTISAKHEYLSRNQALAATQICGVC